MGVTMRDIAERVGVSRPVVSKALLGGRNNIRVSKALQDRIRAVAAEMGYRPHAGARAVSTGRFGQFALVMPPEPYLPQMLLMGIERAVAQRDLHLILALLPDETLTSEGYVPKLLRELSVDGLLVNYIADIPPKMVELIEACGFPAVWINCDRDRDTVRPADYEAGRDVACRLTSQGHQRVAYVHFASPHHYSVSARLAGCRDVLAEQGHQLATLLHHVPSYDQRGLTPRGDDRLARLDHLLSGPDRPTALVCYGSQTAIAAYTAALRRGLDVPRDLSIVTFGTGIVDAPGVAISTAYVPEPRVGEAAVEMLARRVDDPATSEPVQEIPFGWLAGDTIAENQKSRKAGKQ